jgi:hypothetical protein
MSDLPRRVGYTVMFLRMTATEMLELAEHTPDIVRELGTLPNRSKLKQTLSLDT